MAWGVVYLITRSIIFRPLRKLVCKVGLLPCAGVYCEACTGFWVGAALAWLGYWSSVRGPWVACLESASATVGLATVATYLIPSNVFEREQGLPVTEDE